MTTITDRLAEAITTLRAAAMRDDGITRHGQRVALSIIEQTLAAHDAQKSAPGAVDVRQRARELLAQQFHNRRDHDVADSVRAGRLDGNYAASLDAIESALSAAPAPQHAPADDDEIDDERSCAGASPEWQLGFNAAMKMGDQREAEAKRATDRVRKSFQNFHRSLCERVGYTHDPVNWSRDLVSLEEHIANLVSDNRPQPAPVPARPSELDELADEIEATFPNADASNLRAAQPPAPAEAGELPPLPPPFEHTPKHRFRHHYYYTYKQMQDYARAAIAALRQPVDLEQFRQAVEQWQWVMENAAESQSWMLTDADHIADVAKAKHLIALIDSQKVTQ
jgi:hypothetical protein